MSFLRKIKRFVAFSFFLLLVFVIMFLFTLRSENRYMENCKDLGIPCEEGIAHKAQEYGESKVEEWMSKLKTLELWKKSDD
tara:strand:+ start:572 stop:814 length:243 start_codon:yes stop_codon:yes gene_type:complete